MPIRLMPLREVDVPQAVEFLIESREWSASNRTFVPPIAELQSPDSLWLSALSGDELVGIIGFHGISWPDSTAEMFTAVVPKWRGSGASYKLVDSQLEFAFNDLGLRRITMKTLDGSPSAKIADKMKVPLEGRFVRSRLKRGKLVDALAYGLERSAYVSRPKG